MEQKYGTEVWNVSSRNRKNLQATNVKWTT